MPAPDAALAGLFVVIAVLSVLTGNPAEGPLALTLPVAVLSAGSLAWRVRSPLVCIGLLIVTGFVQTLLSQPPGSLWSLAVYAIGMYSLAAHCTEGVAAVAGVVFVASLLIQERIGNGIDFLFIVLLFGGLWLLGRASRYWRLRVSSAERRQQDAARLATAQERVRIARELHDVVAHSLSVIAVQSDAAQAALAKDPARAAAPVEAIGATARQALTEIRSLLDVLRADDGADAIGVAAIAQLAERARAAGVDVTLDVQDLTAALPAAVDLVAYRTVQEGLTNALHHAPGASVQVGVRRAASVLHIEVRNGPSTKRPALSASTGYGLVGIAERVRTLGGRLRTAPTPEGGFALTVDIPLDDEGADS
ncbi:sensor histidine kinase [Microbacterium elymi]|uniref:histidine kinase n=1 Tax=Microbacterium elymi TaxID=2909587 RepID=A0ABY5NJV6_9MICO|nr:sensor histidine kinase [Microbacterium elymi]UUT35445.1 sensor histidine kinase [Microbacterium elymi]